MSTTMSVNDTLEARTEAVRALEAEFGDLINRMRRILADNADRLSPGMLPGAYKVFTTIVRREVKLPAAPPAVAVVVLRGGKEPTAPAVAAPVPAAAPAANKAAPK